MNRWTGLLSVLLLTSSVAEAQASSPIELSDAKLVSRVSALCPKQTFSPSQVSRRQTTLDRSRGRTRPGGENDIDFLLNHDKLTEAQDLMAEGRWEESTSLVCEALQYRYLAFGISDIRTLAAVNDLGVLLRKSGRGDEARSMLEDGIVFTNGLKPSGEPSLDRPLVRARYNLRLNLASALYEQGFYAGSVSILEGLVGPAAGDRALDEDNRSVAETNLGLALGALGRLAEAEVHLRRSLDARLAEDPTGQGVAASMTDLGADLSAEGKFAEGEKMLRRGRKLRADMFGADHLNTAFSSVHLASNLLAQARFAAALPFAEEAQAARQSQLPPGHPDRTISLTVLGNARLRTGDVGGALAAAREATRAQLAHGALEPQVLKVSPLASPLRRLEDPQRLLVQSGWLSLPAVSQRQWRSGSVPPIVDEALVAGQRLTWSSAGDAIAHAAARRVAGDRGLGELASWIEALRDHVEQIDAAVASAAGSTGARNGATLAALRAQRDGARQQLDALAAELKARFRLSLLTSTRNPSDSMTFRS